MNIEKAFYRYPIHPPLKTRHGILSEKKGYILTLTAENKPIARADLTTLLGFSQETIEDSFEECLSLEKQFLTICQSDSMSLKKLLPFLETTCKTPSLRFAFLSLSINHSHKFPSNFCRLQGLIDSKNDLHKTKLYQYLKIKLDKLSLDQALQLTKDTLEKTSSSNLVRLDFGNAWDLETFEAFMNHFPIGQFEYVEDPPYEIFTKKPKSFPLAFDEALRKGDINNIPAGSILVIKPSLDPNFLSFLRRKNNYTIILSSAYEHPIGIKNLIQIANYFELQNAHGFDTYSIYPKALIKKHLSLHSDLLYSL